MTNTPIITTKITKIKPQPKFLVEQVTLRSSQYVNKATIFDRKITPCSLNIANAKDYLENIKTNIKII